MRQALSHLVTGPHTKEGRNEASGFSNRAQGLLMARRLVLNITPIRFKEQELDAELLQYVDAAQIRSLRVEHGGTHFFRRIGDKVWCIALRRDSPLLGGERTTISLSKDLRLASALTHDALLTFFCTHGRLSDRFDPAGILGKEDLLSKYQEFKGILGLRNRVLLSTRVFQFEEQRPFVGITWDIVAERRIEANCAQLFELGLDPKGLYVQTQDAQNDPRLLPRRRVVGRVSKVEGDTVLLDENRDGTTRFELSSLFLEPRIDAFDKCLEMLHRGDVRRLRAELEKINSAERLGLGRFRQIEKLHSWLMRQRIELAPDMPFEIGYFRREEKTKLFPRIIKNDGPTFVFDASGNRTGTSSASGLARHGPYSRQVFTPSVPRICVICERAKRGQVDVFVQRFLNGITLEGGKSPYSSGFARTYDLHSVSVEFFEADGTSAEAFHAAASNAIQASAEGSQWNLALIQTEESSHQLPPTQNPYLVAKAAFLTHSIVSQAFEIETTRMQPYNLAYTLSNMALACYAKLNGTPWRIRSDQTIAHEIIVGLGSASIGEGRFGQRERIVGITSVFLGDGEYIFSNLSQAVSIDDYQQTLLTSLRATFTRVKHDLNWRERDSVRIIVHAFKPMRDIEAKAMKEAVVDLGNFDVQFAFLHIKDHHPIMLFDEESEGVKGRGRFVAERGLCMQLTPYQYALTVSGPRELKQATDGVPRPLLIDLHADSTFRDMLYLVKQALWFTSHSWRSFLPAPMPVTILYSDQVAKLLGKLDSLGRRWNPDVMLGRIGTTRWFL